MRSLPADSLIFVRQMMETVDIPMFQLTRKKKIWQLNLMSLNLLRRAVCRTEWPPLLLAERSTQPSCFQQRPELLDKEMKEAASRAIYQCECSRSWIKAGRLSSTRIRLFSVLLRIHFSSPLVLFRRRTALTLTVSGQREKVGFTEQGSDWGSPYLSHRLMNDRGQVTSLFTAVSFFTFFFLGWANDGIFDRSYTSKLFLKQTEGWFTAPCISLCVRTDSTLHVGTVISAETGTGPKMQISISHN